MADPGHKDRDGEHTPLVRLLAVFYFMGSSMLVQFTTKVRWPPQQASGRGGMQQLVHCMRLVPSRAAWMLGKLSYLMLMPSSPTLLPAPRRRCSPTTASTTR